MYGVTRVTKDVTDELIVYIENHYEELIRYADKQIAKHANGATPLGGDLVSEMYMSFKTNMEDRDGVCTERDACNVVHSYIIEAAKGNKYREGSDKLMGNMERVSWTVSNEDGQELTIADTLEASKTADTELFEHSELDVKLALEFVADSLEVKDPKKVENTVKVLVKLAEELKIIEKEKTPESKAKAAKIIAAVNSMAFKEASDDFKEAFRIMFAQAIAQEGSPVYFMYGVIAKEFREEPEKKFGFLAYKYLMETDKDLENMRNIIRRMPSGDIIEEEVLDKCLEMIMENDYNIDKAINLEVGGVKSIGNYIKDCIGYAYKKVRAEKKHIKEKYGITEQSLYDKVNNHSGKASSDGESSYVEDFVADKNAEYNNAKLTIEETVDKLIRVNNTVCNALVALVVFRDCDEKAKSTALKVLGLDSPNRRDAMNEEVFDVIQDLVQFETIDIVKELYNQIAEAEQFEQVMHVSLSQYIKERIFDMVARELAERLLESPELEVEISIGIRKKSLFEKFFMRKNKCKTYRGYSRSLENEDLYYGEGKVSISAFLDLQ